MAEIQEYLPQTSAQEPVGGVSPNIELAGSVGRAIEHIGGALEDAGTVIHRAQTQKESADAYEAVAYARAGYSQQIQQGIQDGSLNVDNIMEKYDSEMTDAGGKLTTPGAQNLFQRQNSRLRGYLLKMANTGATQVTYNETLGKLQQGRNTNSDFIENSTDPLGSFLDVFHGEQEKIQTDVDNQQLPEKLRGKAEMEAGTQYAESAIRGLAKINPDRARAALEPKLSNGQDNPLIPFLSADKRKELGKEIDTVEKQNDVEKDRAFAQHERAMKLSEESWYTNNFDKLTSGNLSVDDVRDGVKQGKIRGTFGMEMVNAINKTNDRDLKTKPDDYQDVVERMTDVNSTNPISSFDQVLPYIADGRIAADGPHSAKTIKWLWDNISPQGKALKTNMAGLIKEAKSAILYPDTQGGKGNDPNSVNKYNQFIADIGAKMNNAGADAKNLLDPTNKDYLGGPNLKPYTTPLSERYSAHLQDRTDKANGMRPTGTNPTPTPSPKARKPGESISDWEKRK